MFKHFKHYLSKKSADKVLAAENRLKYFIKSERLKELVYSCNEMGISNQKYCDYEIIVSLTTYGKRLYDVAITIESIMQGSMLPNKIILWLAEEYQNVTLPLSLQRQQKRGLNIKFCKDTRSYKKLIPSLFEYPNSIIVTIDDDALYYQDLLENLYLTYTRHPNCICANRVHTIKLNKDGKPLPYYKWLKNNDDEDLYSPLTFLTGVGGVLYPPDSLDREVFNESVFLDICKYADDVWFYAMALKKGTTIIKSHTHSSISEDFIDNPDVQDISLGQVNYKNQNMNDIQLQSVLNKYELYSSLKQNQV